MSVFYQVDERNNHIYAHLSGHFCNDDAIDFAADLIADQRIQAGFTLLFDATDAASMRIDQCVVSSLLELEHMFPAKFCGARRAFVFNSRSGSEWALQFKARAQGSSHISYMLEDALQWLAQGV